MQDDFSTETFWKDFTSYKEDFVPEDFSIDKVHIFDSIDSTNSELLRRLENARDVNDLSKTLVSASSQSAGRGRVGRKFYSPDKTGIYFSFVHIPGTKDFNPAAITASASVAVSRAIEKVFGVETKIKWVNDVYVGEKKVSGILAEGFSGQSGFVQAVVIGIGINIVMGSCDADIGKAGGIISADALEYSPSTYRSKLLAACMKELFFILDTNQDFIAEYREKSFLKNKIVKVSPLAGNESGSYEAKVLDITDSACLLVQMADGTKKELSSGEVTLHQL
ncbi:MAG: biotin--[Treponema sp.]|nr:biotin--[acetyl-CoA-carboxylase] ligase [Treponema sp.]